MNHDGKQPKKVRTRFAPSPTGFLHVGGVRTALFAWLVARQAKGQFILRIEDTDKAREVEGSEKHIQDSLRWLGLDWDEGPDKGQSYGPYRQSQRLDIYKQWASKLIELGRAYADPFTREELDGLRRLSSDTKKPFLFREHRPEKPPSWDGKTPLRFKSEPKPYKWHDEVMGELSTGPEVIDDFIIIKSDGYPTYNFAHIVDDHLMEITHVVRSQEFLSSVPKFLNLYEALGIVRPALATLPYVTATDGKKKLSKRDGAKDILDYQKEGYLPGALINFLATLGWNDGTEQEIFSVDELIAKFSLARVQKSGAKFDEQRLLWMNGYHIRQLPLDGLYSKTKDFWPTEARQSDDNYKLSVLGLLQERLKTLSEISKLSDFFFSEPTLKEIIRLYDFPEDKQLIGLLEKRGTYKKILTTTVESLQQSDFSVGDIQNKLNGVIGKFGVDVIPRGVMLPVIRIAVTGKKESPDLFGTLSVLGKEKSLSRLKDAATALDK